MQPATRQNHEVHLEGPPRACWACRGRIPWAIAALVLIVLLVLLTWPRVVAYTPVSPAAFAEGGEPILALARMRASFWPVRRGVRILWEVRREGNPDPLFTGAEEALSAVPGDWQAVIRLPGGVKPLDELQWEWQGRILWLLPSFHAGSQSMVLGVPPAEGEAPQMPRAVEPLTGEQRVGDAIESKGWRDAIRMTRPYALEEPAHTRVRFLWTAAPLYSSATAGRPAFFRGWNPDPGAGLGNTEYYVLRYARWEGDPNAPELQPWTDSPEHPALGHWIYRYVPAPGGETDRVSFEDVLEPGAQYVWSVARVVNGVRSEFSHPFHEGTGMLGEAFTTVAP